MHEMSRWNRRLLKPHPTLMVSGWTGFKITVRDNMVVNVSLISYQDTIVSQTTD